MKHKLLTFTGVLVVAAVLGNHYATPLMAQVRAALVSDVDNPARGFVQMTFLAHLPSGIGTFSLQFDPQYAVQPGKRLVIDTVSATSQNLGAHQATSGLWLLAGSAGDCVVSSDHFPFNNPIAIVPLIYNGASSFGGNIYSGIAHLQSYLDSGQCLAIRIDHESLVDSSVTYRVTVSGHLVTLP